MLLKNKAPSNKEKPTSKKSPKRSPKQEKKHNKIDHILPSEIKHKKEPLLNEFADFINPFNKSNPIDIDNDKEPVTTPKELASVSLKRKKTESTKIKVPKTKKQTPAPEESCHSEKSSICIIEDKENLNKNGTAKDFQFPLGSLVWAKVPGFSWWPAIVDNDPDIFMFYWYKEDTKLVTHYHVTFLDEDVSRVWVSLRNIRLFEWRDNLRADELKLCKKVHHKQFNSAMDTVEICLTMEPEKRIERYGFVTRFTGKSNIWARAVVKAGERPGRLQGLQAGFRGLFRQAEGIEARSGGLLHGANSQVDKDE